MKFFKSFPLNILLLYKQWCDDNDRYVDTKEALEEFLIDIKDMILDAIKFRR